MDPTVQGIILAVSGTLAGALVTSYLGRPSRAALREEKLDAYRSRRQLSDSALRLGITGAMLAVPLPDEMPPGGDPVVLVRLKADRDRAVAKIDEVTLTLLDDVGHIGGTFFGAPVRNAVLGYITTMRAVALSARPDTVKGEIYRDCSNDLMEMLRGRIWGSVRRTRAMFRLQARIDRLNEPEPAEATAEAPAAA